MMDRFVVRYIPGGMSLNHSGFWLCVVSSDGHASPIRMLEKVDYK
jgi:hypothetical protein